MHTVTIEAETSRAAVMTVRCDMGLVDNGEDAYDRCIDLITRAQIPFFAKTQLHEQLDTAKKRMDDGLYMITAFFGSDRYKTLGLALYELMTATKKR